VLERPPAARLVIGSGGSHQLSQRAASLAHGLRRGRARKKKTDRTHHITNKYKRHA
jgi:hypothetical protein